MSRQLDFGDRDNNGYRDEDLISVLRLAMVSGVGPRIRRALLERFGTAAEVLNAPPSQLREVQGVGPKLSRAIYSAVEEIDVEGEIERCRQNNVRILIESDDAYPRLLHEIHNPPGVLFVRGELLPEDAISIAIVGTRHASHYGRTQAERLASELSRAGFTIVSGLARGIDGEAHRGTLKAGGRTVAVLGSGVLNIYPPEHNELAAEIAERGAVISESPCFSPPMSGAFPQRNRLITGMTLGVIVVEAAERSGAMISARHAMEQGREVFAMPGRVDNRNARGCHRLIRDGAKLVETADDILEELGPLVEATPREDGQVVHHPAELQLNEQEKRVLAAITTEPTSIDHITTASEVPIHQVLSTISVLEMRHLIRRVSGNTVARL